MEKVINEHLLHEVTDQSRCKRSVAFLFRGG